MHACSAFIYYIYFFYMLFLKFFNKLMLLFFFLCILFSKFSILKIDLTLITSTCIKQIKRNCCLFVCLNYTIQQSNTGPYCHGTTCA